MDNIVLVGGGGHAKVIAGMIARGGLFQLTGYTDPCDRGPLAGSPYLGDDDALPSLTADVPFAALGIGHSESARVRREVFARLLGMGFSFPPIVAPGAHAAESGGLAAGVAVMDGAVVQPGARIGQCAIVNSNATVEHDCRIGEFTHVAPGAVLCGGAEAGDDTLVGAGAVVLPGRVVVARCTIGAGAVVTTDCREPGTYAGVPARRIA